MIKILQVTTSFPLTKESYSGIFVKRFVESLQKEFNVKNIILVPDSNKETNNIFDYKIIKYRYAFKNKQKLAHSSGGIAKSISLNNIPYLISLSLMMSIYVKKLEKNFDLIHAHWTQNGFFSSLLTKKPLIITAHGSDIHLSRKNKIMKILHKLALKRANYVVYVSKTIFEEEKKLYPQYQSKMYFVSNGVNEEFFNIKFENKPKDKKRLIFIGSFIKGKGIDLLIKSLEKLKDQYDFIFYFVGSGPLKDLIIKILDNKKIFCLGQTSPDQIPSLLEKAHILVLPSRKEGRASVLLEALASETMIISSDIGESKLLVEESNSGFLFESGLAYDLYQKLKLCLELDLSEIKKYAKNAKSYALTKNLKWSQTSKEYYKLYQKLVFL